MGNPAIDGPASEGWPNKTEEGPECPPPNIPPETGEPPVDTPELSGENKRMSITLRAEGYGESVTEWLVPEELVRPYAIAYNSAIAAAGLEISKAIYEKLIESGADTAEAFIAKEMINANSKN